MKAPILFLTLVVAVLITGCAKKCDEPDIQLINSLYFELKQGGSDGFSTEELEELYLVRFVQMSDPLIADTFYTDGIFPEGTAKIIINDNYPFPNNQSPYYPVYGYELVMQSAGFLTIIENIELVGEYDGSCGYNNLQKSFDLNGTPVDRSGNTDFLLLTK